MTLIYKLTKTSRWKHLVIEDIDTLKNSVLWKYLETYSGEIYLRFRGRYCQLNTTIGQAQSLCYDVLYYMLETKSYRGVITYQNRGEAKWYPDKISAYALASSLTTGVWCILALCGMGYFPVWLLALVFYIKYRQML